MIRIYSGRGEGKRQKAEGGRESDRGRENDRGERWKAAGEQERGQGTASKGISRGRSRVREDGRV